MTSLMALALHARKAFDYNISVWLVFSVTIPNPRFAPGYLCQSNAPFFQR